MRRFGVGRRAFRFGVGGRRRNCVDGSVVLGFGRGRGVLEGVVFIRVGVWVLIFFFL